MGVQALATRQPTAVAAELAELAQHLDLPDTARPILAALQSLLAGTRDPALADDPHLDYDDTAAPHLLLDPPGSP
jgi:hypothetical protein